MCSSDLAVKKFNDLPNAHHANVDVDTPPYQRRPGQRPQLTDGEIDDIVAFLFTLTDGYKPSLGGIESRPSGAGMPPREQGQPTTAPARRGDY